MRRQLNRVIAALQAASVFLIVLGLTACGGGANVQKAVEDNGSVTLASVNSAQTGAVYPIYIHFPASYASGTAAYPVIYATDGDAPFPPESRFVNFAKILERRHIDAILVGIGGTARRNKDYVLPGAVAYHDFITRELIPSVESHFRADPQRRILSGISLGGSFVVTALFLEAPKTLFFSHYISAEGSFQQPSFIGQEQHVSSMIGTKSIPATLILARAASNNAPDLQSFGGSGSKSMPATVNLASFLANQGTNSAEVDSLYRRMVNRHYVDLVLIETKFGTDHIGTDNPSFEDAMARIFK